MIDGLLVAADHHAIAAVDAPDAAGRAAIDIADVLRGQRLGAANVVLVEAVAAVDDDVVLVEQAAQLFHRLFGDGAGRQHDPDRPRSARKRLDQFLQRRSVGRTLLGERLACICADVEHHAFVPGLHQTPHHVAAHAAKAHETDLHKSVPFRSSAEGHRPDRKSPVQPKLGAKGHISTDQKENHARCQNSAAKMASGWRGSGAVGAQPPATTTLWLSSSLGRSAGNWLPVTM